MALSLPPANEQTLSANDVANVQANLDTIQANFVQVGAALSLSLDAANLQTLSVAQVANIQANLDIIESNFNLIQAAVNNIVDVTLDNTRDVIYVKGNETTDGSIRLIPDLVGGEDVQFQLRTAGVWNDTGIVVASASVLLGRELQLSSGGEFLRTTSLSDPTFQSLTPHIEFTPENGTDLYCHIPTLEPLAVRRLIQTDDSGLITGSTIQYFGPAPANEILTAVYYRTGPTADSAPVNLTFRRDSFTGIIFFTNTYPAGTFPANTEVHLQLPQPVSAVIDQNIFVTFTSTADLSIRFEATNTLPWLAVDAFDRFDEDAMTSTTGMDRVLIDLLGGVIAGNAGTLVLDGNRPLT